MITLLAFLTPWILHAAQPVSGALVFTSNGEACALDVGAHPDVLPGGLTFEPTGTRAPFDDCAPNLAEDLARLNTAAHLASLNLVTLAPLTCGLSAVAGVGGAAMRISKPKSDEYQAAIGTGAGLGLGAALPGLSRAALKSGDFLTRLGALGLVSAVCVGAAETLTYEIYFYFHPDESLPPSKADLLKN